MSSAVTGPSKARLLELTKLSKQIFHESFNPSQARRGTSVLRSTLRGPAVKDYYYPSQFLKFKNLKSMFPDLYLMDAKEQYRLDINNDRRRRGKGAPPKSKGPKDEKAKKKK